MSTSSNNLVQSSLGLGFYNFSFIIDVEIQIVEFLVRLLKILRNESSNSVELK